MIRCDEKRCDVWDVVAWWCGGGVGLARVVAVRVFGKRCRDGAGGE